MAGKLDALRGETAELASIEEQPKGMSAAGSGDTAATEQAHQAKALRDRGQRAVERLSPASCRVRRAYQTQRKLPTIPTEPFRDASQGWPRCASCQLQHHASCTPPAAALDGCRTVVLETTCGGVG